MTDELVRRTISAVIEQTVALTGSHGCNRAGLEQASKHAHLVLGTVILERVEQAREEGFAEARRVLTHGCAGMA